MGACHVRTGGASLRPGEPPVVVQYRPLLAGAHRGAVRDVLARPEARVLDICCGTGDLVGPCSADQGAGGTISLARRSSSTSPRLVE